MPENQTLCKNIQKYIFPFATGMSLPLLAERAQNNSCFCDKAVQKLFS